MNHNVCVSIVAPPVSVLFNEPKLLKLHGGQRSEASHGRFSALQRAEIAEIQTYPRHSAPTTRVSVLFNEPKLLKSRCGVCPSGNQSSFSALQRAEIAEMQWSARAVRRRARFSALQRAEIAEMINSSAW